MNKQVLVLALLLLCSLPAVASNQFDPIIQAQASRTGVPAQMIKSIIRIESAFKPKAVSDAGAMGLMQLMPDTAKRFGVTQPFNPQQNIAAGSQYLQWLWQRYQDWSLVLAAYNAGEGKVDRYQGIPPYRETRNYVRKVLKEYQRLSGSPVQNSQPTVRAQQARINHQQTTHTESMLFQEMLAAALAAETAVQWTPPPNYYTQSGKYYGDKTKDHHTTKETGFIRYPRFATGV